MINEKNTCKNTLFSPWLLSSNIEQGCHEVFALESLNVVLTIEAFEEWGNWNITFWIVVCSLLEVRIRSSHSSTLKLPLERVMLPKDALIC